MMTFLMVTFFILLIVALMVAIARRTDPVFYNDINDEVITHTTVTTTTTTHDDPAPASATVPITAGTITRGWQDNKPYLIDPVDGSTMQLAETDDLYEDAAGKLWKLV